MRLFTHSRKCRIFVIFCGFVWTLVLSSTVFAQTYTYYWKDNNNNGQWDWSNNQWWYGEGGYLVGGVNNGGGAIIYFENNGQTATTINNASAFSGGWFKLNSIYAAANSTGRNYSVSVVSGQSGIELYGKIETISGGGTLSFANIDVQLGANAEINAVGNTVTLGGLRINGKTLNSYGANSLNIQGVILGTGTYNIKNQGITVTYSGSGANTFSGATTVENSSTLTLNKSAGTAAIGGNLTINSGATLNTSQSGQLNNQFVTVNGTFNMNNNNQSLALAGSGTVNMGTAILTNNNTSTDTFSGKLSGSGGQLVKANTGTLILSGGTSDYTGATTVAQGTLAVSANNALGTTAAGTTVASGATLDFQNINYSTAEAVTLNGGSIAASTGTSTLAGGVTLGAASIYNIAGTQLTQSGIITDGASSFGITKSGSGTLVLSADNTYDGGTTISAGTVSIGKDLALGNVPSATAAANITLGGGTLAITTGFTMDSKRGITLNTGGGTIEVAASQTLTYGGIITGGNAFTKTGSGGLTLSGVNTYTGTTTVSAGTITLGAAGVIADSSNLSVSSGATFALANNNETVGSISGAGSITLGSATLTSSTTANSTFSGAISGTGAFTKAGSGNLTLSGVSTYTGLTTVSAGTITLSGSGGIAGDLSVSSGATFDLGGTSETLGSITGAGSIALGSGTLTTDSGSITTFSGVISGSGALVKSGVGTLTLSGSSANTFSGTTTINNGVLVLQKDAGVNALAGTPTINSGAILRLGAGNQFNGDSTFLTINSGGTFEMNGFNDTLAFQGAGTVDLGSGTLTMNPGSTDTFSGKITGSGGLIKVNAGTQILSGSTSDYTGTTTVNAGYLEIRTAAALGASGAGQGTTVASGAVLTYSNATSMSIAEGLTLNGTGVSGIGGALKNVSGSNTQTGAITLGSSARIAATGGSLAIQGNIGGGSNVLYLGTDGGSISISSIISGAGATQDGTTTSIFKDGSGTLTLTGANTFTGDTRISAGKITIGTGGSLGSGSDVFLASAGTLEVNANTAVASVQEWAGSNSGVIAIGTGATLTIDGANKGTLYQNSISGLGGLTMAGSGTTSLSLFGTQSYSGLTSVSGGKISTGVVLSNSSGVAVSGGTFETSAVNILKDTATVTISGTGTYSLGGNDTVASLTMTGGTLSGAGTMTATSDFAIQAGTISAGLGGSVGLNKTGSGTATLSGSSSYSGKTTISAGILEVTSSNALGNGGAGNGVDIASGARLRATANMTNARAITITSGTGYVEASGGTTNTLNGTLTKNGTTLVLGGAGTHIVNGSIVGANANSDLYVSNSTTTINSTNSYNGPTFIVAGGTLINGTNNALPTDTALTLGQSDDSASVTNTYNLSGKDQRVASIAATGTAAANIITNSTGTANLTLSNTVNTSFSNLKMGGSGLTLTKSGSNTVTLTSGNTIGPGTIAIQQGTLLLGAANQIGDTTAITLNGGTLSTAGYADEVGKLTVSGNSTIQGLNSTSGVAFTFSDIDLSTYSGSGGSTLTFLNSSGGNYSLGTVFQISTIAASSWTGYSETSLNNFSQKIQFGNGNVGQLSFGSGISGTTLTVAAIPDARVYTAAVVLLVLIGVTEYRRRRRLCRR